jgi:hypothetical protein
MLEVNEKDLKAIKEAFFVFEKAKFDGLDGNDIVRIYKAFINLQALENKVREKLKEEAKIPALPKDA